MSAVVNLPTGRKSKEQKIYDRACSYGVTLIDLMRVHIADDDKRIVCDKLVLRFITDLKNGLGLK